MLINEHIRIYATITDSTCMECDKEHVVVGKTEHGWICAACQLKHGDDNHEPQGCMMCAAKEMSRAINHERYLEVRERMRRVAYAPVERPEATGDIAERMTERWPVFHITRTPSNDYKDAWALGMRTEPGGFMADSYYARQAVMYSPLPLVLPAPEAPPQPSDEDIDEMRQQAINTLAEAREDAYKDRDGAEAARIDKEIERVKAMSAEQLLEWLRSDGGVG